MAFLLSSFWLSSSWGLLLLLASQSVQAQSIVPTSPDTATASASVPLATPVRRTTKLFGHSMTVPAKAAYLSAMLPGMGQVYNKKYWKLPLVYGAIGGTAYGLVYYQQLYREFTTAKRVRWDDNPKTKDEGKHSAPLSDSSVLFYQSRFRTQRDSFIGYTALAYGFGILDALVDAHLRDFDMDDNLAWRCSPTLLHLPTTIVPGVAVVINLPSHSL